MKLSLAIAPNNAPPTAFVVFRGLEESIAKASALGFQGVELAISCREDANLSRLDGWLAQNSMEVSAISTGLVWAKSHLSLLQTPVEAQKVFRELIDVAAEHGQLINIGRSRGEKGALSLEDAAEKLKTTLLPLLEYGEKKGVSFVLEPVNRYEVDWIRSVPEGARVADLIGAENLGLMPDVFHMNIEDAGIAKTLLEYRQYVRYVHLADSNRHAPGQGHLPFAEIFAALREMQYDRWLSVEILPYPSPEEAAKNAAEYLLPFIHAGEAK